MCDPGPVGHGGQIGDAGGAVAGIDAAAARAEDVLGWTSCGFAAAEASSVELGSKSLRAAAWLARGDLASARGDVARAAALFRQAAEALQDSSF